MPKSDHSSPKVVKICEQNYSYGHSIHIFFLRIKKRLNYREKMKMATYIVHILNEISKI